MYFEPTAADIEITVYVDLNAESEEQVQEAFRAAAMLEEMGFLVTVQPITIKWDGLAYGSLFGPQTPIVEVNGLTLSEGKLVKAEEIVAHALARLGLNGDSKLLVAWRGGDEGEVSVEIAS